MRRWMVVIGAMVATTSLVVACGGSSNKKTIDTGNGGKVTISGDLPKDFPSDFPIYKGAKYQGGYEGTQGGVKGFAATWTSSDSFEKVRDYYDKTFKEGDWIAGSSGSTGSDGAFWLTENKSKKLTGYVLVSTVDGKTSITCIVGNDDGSSTPDDESTDTPDSGSDSTPTSSGGSGGGSLPAEAKLDKDFPKDTVYIPSGARVTSTSNFTSGGTSSYSVELYIKSDVDKVSDDFKQGLQGKGWTNALSANQNGEVLQSYTRGEGDTTNAVTISIAKSDVDGYVQVSMSVILTAQ